ncbi:hypothetical protein B0H17DRAFT_1211206 [Mycena rosella]|uniref:Uncharacterized protein n=1 Tax=Mycena rosella TaxID=1033263 RepID=A0AAD7CUL9_MYCRO|nr:hypothetical protein B0H17DRAFT_1211206 [Mycena rosella]
MAPVPIGVVVLVITSYGEGAPPHSFFMKCQVLFIILFLGLGFLAYMSVGPVSSIPFSHDRTSFFQLVSSRLRPSATHSSPRPSPSPRSRSVITVCRAEMQERRARLERDARCMGYISQGKILSGKGRS